MSTTDASSVITDTGDSKNHKKSTTNIMDYEKKGNFEDPRNAILEVNNQNYTEEANVAATEQQAKHEEVTDYEDKDFVKYLNEDILPNMPSIEGQIADFMSEARNQILQYTQDMLLDMFGGLGSDATATATMDLMQHDDDDGAQEPVVVIDDDHDGSTSDGSSCVTPYCNETSTIVDGSSVAAVSGASKKKNKRKKKKKKQRKQKSEESLVNSGGSSSIPDSSSSFLSTPLPTSIPHGCLTTPGDDDPVMSRDTMFFSWSSSDAPGSMDHATAKQKHNEWTNAVENVDFNDGNLNALKEQFMDIFVGQKDNAGK